MDFNEEEEFLISLREMENSDEDGQLHENGVSQNGYTAGARHTTYAAAAAGATTKAASQLLWLDLRVFYARFSKCVIRDDSAPECLTLNYVPLTRDTLLEVNGTRTGIYSDGISSFLKRDRLDKRSEEATFVSTDGIRMAGSVKFEVFHEDVLLLTGSLEFCQSNGFLGESRSHCHDWNMNCESDVHPAGTAQFLKGNQKQQVGLEQSSPAAIEVYVAGCYSGSPIILTKTLQLSQCRKKQGGKGMLESIPEYEATLSQGHDQSSLAIQSINSVSEYKPLEHYCGMEYFEGEDGELSWFNAGVRVGVGIGLSLCLGVGIGVGLLARTYHFPRRIM